MPALAPRPRLGSRGTPEESRAAILQAAIEEFAGQGIEGARIDFIARSARVNKALLYYYFHDKEGLYGAVLDQVFGGLHQAVMPCLESSLPPRDKILAYVGRYFDYIAGNPQFPRVVQGEMMRAGRNKSPHLQRLAKQHVGPIFAAVTRVLQQGIAAGEFRPVDPVHFVLSMVALVVFYFSSAPAMKFLVDFDPLAPQHIAERRAAVLDFVSAALLLPQAFSGERP